TEVTISIDKISLNQKNVIELKEFNAGKEASVISNTEQAIKNVDPKSLISRQNSNEISGSDIKRLVRDMKANGFDTTQPIDVAIVNGKMIIIDGHHRAAAAVKAGIKDIPIRINKVTEAQGNQLLLEAAEARSRY
ncbi:ParB N-terminal domain-containing protein, partial [Frischella sp. Ac13]